jgi:hypothetical protein
MYFFQGGCVNCGEPRISQAEKQAGFNIADRNIYVANDQLPELVLGLCGECYKIPDSDFDLAKIKASMLESEIKAAQLKTEQLASLELRSIRKRKG